MNLNFKIINKMSNPAEYLEVKPDNNSVENLDEKFSETEVKRESLAILASLGTTKEYICEEMSLSDITKLKGDVLKLHNRYQSVLGKQLHKGLIEGFISTAVKGLSYLINFDDAEELSRDLQKDEQVKRELSLISGQLVLRGGRLVSIGSALFHVIRHIDFSPDKRSMGQSLEQSIEQSHEQRPEQSHEKSPDIGVDEHTPPPHLREANTY